MSIYLKEVQLLYLFIRRSFTESNTSIRIYFKKRIKGKYVIMHRQKLLLKIYYLLFTVVFLAAVPPISFSFDFRISLSTNLSLFSIPSLIIEKVLLLVIKGISSLAALTKSENSIDKAYNQFDGLTLLSNLLGFCSF